MFWGNHMGMMSGWGFLLSALLWIGLIALGIWLLARLFPAGGSSQASAGQGGRPPVRAERQETPLEILQRRYARGEITKEEYETIRYDLTS